MSTLYYKGRSYTPSEVEANPSGDPTDTLETIGIGGTVFDIVGGNVYGAFIDTNRVIQPFILVQDTQEHSYTATEDCIVIYNIANAANTDTYIKVDNILMGGQYTQNINSAYGYVYLKTGQIFTYQQTYTGSTVTGYMVYGLTFGTNNIFTPQIYSLEEREVGVWIDGKPLYQKTIQFAPTQANDWQSHNHEISNIEKVVNSWMIVNYNNVIAAYPVPQQRTGQSSGFSYYIDSTFIQYINSWLSTESLVNVTIQYTKTTDTAGSGDWTPSGVPAHHYSTDEQVVGTWIDGSTVYEKSFSGLSIIIPSNTWVDSGCSIPGINKVIDIKAYANRASISAIGDPASDGVIRLMGMRNAAVTLEQFTIRYTKSTT